MATEFHLFHNKLEDILKSEEVIKEMRKIADRIVEDTPKPGNYEVEEWVGHSRARVSIKTNGIPAHVREARDHDLIQALAREQH